MGPALATAIGSFRNAGRRHSFSGDLLSILSMIHAPFRRDSLARSANHSNAIAREFIARNEIKI